MRCTEANHFFTELADHALAADHEARRHVASCQRCSSEFQQYQLLIARLGALPRPKLSRDLRRAVHARLDARHEKRPILVWRFWVPASALATVFIAGWVTLTDFQSDNHWPTEMASMQEHPGHAEVAITGATADSSEPASISLQDFMEAYYEVSQPKPAASDLHLRPVWEALDAADPLRAALETNSSGVAFEAISLTPAH